MPHRTQMQVIKRRLVGKTGSERICELRSILGDLAGYKNGPYADIRPPVTDVDVADAIHRELGSCCLGARVWGPSARFDGQKLGPSHVLQDGDTVEILAAT
jgi:TGS domain